MSNNYIANKLVLLDGHTINPGDLSWQKLADLAREFTVYESTPPHLLSDRIGDCDVLMTSKCIIRRELMEHAPNLKFIGSTATGYNNIDIAAAKDLGIAVTNIPAYSTESVAQHTIALLLELTNHAGLHDRSVKDGDWSRCEHFCYWKQPVMLLSGKSLGIIGYGSIGSRVAQIARALGMEVNIYSRDREAAIRSDVVSLHCPLTKENEKMINEDFIRQMKPGALLINTARGGLIDEEALALALKEGRIAGAALDVLSSEPPAPDHPLTGLDNCIITPHIAWVPVETRQTIIDVLAENLMDWAGGGRLNRVDL